MGVGGRGLEWWQAQSVSDGSGGACRFCGATLDRLVVDLGVQPLANSYLSAKDLAKPEATYPLRVYVCDRCLLVQLRDYPRREEIFNDSYAYFASYSASWLEHAKRYVGEMIDRLALDEQSLVVEIASNDGYLLCNFVSRGIPVLGIEPSSNTAEVARVKGVPTETVFFGSETADRVARERGRADLIIGNNVLAHVPDLNDFVSGMRTLLAPTGTITMEFPHLLHLVAAHEFDTIYHEHYSYLSLLVVRAVFAHHGLDVFDVDELDTHGGSLRIYARHAGESGSPVSPNVAAVLEREHKAMLDRPEGYAGIAREAGEVREGLLVFLAKARDEHALVAGYGAPAKGNTLLNFCGVTTADIAFTVDRSPHKQDLFLPGSRIPIKEPEYLVSRRPDYVLILPWNLTTEIVEQMDVVRGWGGRFVTPIPELRILD